ncbi:alpha/beta hydrolase [Sodalis sp. dw_96]|uniref:alpha/beta fold hydrolase n=1 Tax=Sodalis sp. dw_96 TaxID=2719794 RepID=UPI001BD55751|nr:alpha/beta hydrolase [Sodalis sp. dw_96]
MTLGTEIIGPSPFIAGFTLSDIELSNGIRLRVAIGGKGAPLLLLHGHPQTHATWRKVAPELAKRFTVIAPDLRGYGDSGKPESDAQHRPYSKREMARDMKLLMDGLGYSHFAVVGHDRGGRVAHRLALDYQQSVTRAVFIDIAPTATMYARTDKTFATRYFWWFFLIQPAPLPEKLISADPAFFLEKHISGQLKTPGATEPEIFNEYLRCYANPQTLHAICEDYRAAATIDLADDEADRAERIIAPVLALWGAKGTVGQLYDVVETWREKALDVRGNALPCGHSPQEEIPRRTLDELLDFLA